MRQTRSQVATVLAGALVWAVLVLPDAVAGLTPWAFLRVPLEGLLLLAVLLVLPARARRPSALLLGAALGLLVLLKSLDLGFSAVLDRRFHEVDDWPSLGLGYAVLRVWVGPTGAKVALALVVATALLLVSLLVPATLRVERTVSRHRRTAARVLLAGSALWGVGALGGLQVAGAPVASASTVRLVAEHAVGVVEDAQAGRAFARALAEDPHRGPGADLLAGLEGKDVLLVFVESYGRAALTEPALAPWVGAVLDSGTQQLGRAGYAARSAYLTSPTLGGSSWLPHATLQSGLWTPDQARYDQLLAARRLTLTSAFGQAGWDTSFVLPAVRGGWPQGEAFYGFDRLVGGDDLGYRGPALGWGAIPDQYTLSQVERLLLAPSPRRPVMAEVDLVTSHLPWPPPPPLVGWEQVGDGSVLACMPGCGGDPARVEGMEHVQERYGASIRYVLRALTSFLVSHPDPDLVVVLLGDHQPWTFVTGPGAGHDVPVTILSADPEVLERVQAWGWSEGLRPAADAPVWRMDAFRDRFLAAFSGRTP